MSLIIKFTTIVLISKLVQPLKISQNQNGRFENAKNKEQESFRKYFDLLTSSEKGKLQKGLKFQRAKELYNNLAQKMSPQDLQNLLVPANTRIKPKLHARTKLRAEPQLDQQFGHQVEKELMRMILGTQSQLLGRPYLEQTGANDYLVIKNNKRDPYVTVVPNSVYYNIEKKCVNWLDDCSLQGIRAKLLHKIDSPFK